MKTIPKNNRNFSHGLKQKGLGPGYSRNESNFFLIKLNKRTRFDFQFPSVSEREFFSKRSIKIDELDKLEDFETLLKYGIDIIQLKDDYFFNRIRELKELCDLEEDYDLSLESLKTLLLFVGSIENMSKPSSLTVSEDGLFYLEWEKDRKNSVTARFKKDYFLDYAIFQPSSHIRKRIVYSGSMYALELIDYFDKLSITLHKQV
ncbi:MAG: hypothetical protein SW833_15790 [Cyanobacteriota bacterium]|nr:hypothetical protein [Cyanobacteriota bacterium]